ncbi:glycoside hydrolase family 18 protein [Hyalangium rubrum]|uniref:Glycoside hydrolase family 18 protein n=1 Tax=Hyalangium rubrum TaxID=3103134 RepID=A0ABU5H704_9BACT|nr:glycoside hydrolase family 18 protein [Hyalangium sp. s54d21]MDY7227875.1 glycoside hydrolase family 18 protein [Hyalangium sp. s54d21]
MSAAAKIWSLVRRPGWRILTPVITLALLVCLGYALWSPGQDVTDGRHDLGRNGMWLQHGWMGDDSWFERNNKKDRIPHFRDSARVAELAQRLREHRITDVFPHVAPAQLDGKLPPVDSVQTERFLQGMEGFRVMPWVGGVLDDDCFPKIPGWRAGFVRSIQELFQAHPRLAGVHVNIEPWPSGHPELLTLLEEIRAVLPPGKLLSVAAYPPPTRWHPYTEVHWDAAYYREVARRTDQLAVMMYDTALRVPKVYQWLMTEWTQEVLAWSGGTPVLLGLPAYEDTGVGYHHPHVENVPTGLRGIHAGLSARSLPANYQGVALYSDWVMDDAEWRHLREHFLKPASP